MKLFALHAIVVVISIHALLAESDLIRRSFLSVLALFLSTLSLRRATKWEMMFDTDIGFLSTLSLRRATIVIAFGHVHDVISIHALLAESDYHDNYLSLGNFISIHALLAESDYLLGKFWDLVGISIHALLAESDFPTALGMPKIWISIHALLAESDVLQS